MSDFSKIFAYDMVICFPDDNEDLPYYSWCGYMRFCNTKFFTYAYDLLTENQKVCESIKDIPNIHIRLHLGVISLGVLLKYDLF